MVVAFQVLCFNSTLVQLKEIASLIDGRYEFCFNSTLVQLKEIPRLIYWHYYSQFQFYLSSIKRDSFRD